MVIVVRVACGARLSGGIGIVVGVACRGGSLLWEDAATIVAGVLIVVGVEACPGSDIVTVVVIGGHMPVQSGIVMVRVAHGRVIIVAGGPRGLWLVSSGRERLRCRCSRDPHMAASSSP